ncbi:prolyl-tRNA editing protein proX [Synergistales bacterium]|nr:prolyl-tRNA editing protein proX [Synergistales bacterium]
MEMRDAVLKRLDEMGIAYEIDSHEPVYTIEAMESLGLDKKGDVVKNLFLRDAKGKRHFLVLLQKDKTADLKAIRAILGCSALSFASEERLEKYMKLTKGAVSPLGVINDTEHAVEVVVDRDLTNKARLGVHPNDNTATIWLSWDSLKKIIESNGNGIRVINLK